MSASSLPYVNASAAPVPHAAQGNEGTSLSPAALEFAGRVQSWFATAPHVFDGEQGEVLQRAPGPYREEIWGPLCREVVRRGEPQLIDEAGPIGVLAIPQGRRSSDTCIAVVPFLMREVDAKHDPKSWCQTFSLNEAEARQWLAGRSFCSPELMERMANQLAAAHKTESRVARLETESNELSERISATYEEISLLHRLTQNLRISEDERELGRRSLQWLTEVIPAEGLAMQLELLPMNQAQGVVQDDGETESFQTIGRCPVDRDNFAQLIEHLHLTPRCRPYVANENVTQAADWPFPDVRELIVVPLAEGDNLFGWVAAFNRTQEAEFGTSEASLLSSVSTILGIHSGNIELYRQQAELLAGVIRALTSAIDAKDPYTCGHSDRVARVSVRIAQEMGLDQETLRTLYLGGLLHDIGKIGINDSVLRKPGKLTAAEFEHIKSHAEIGYNILKDLKALDPMLPLVRHHHESWDGRGYPDGLAGENIPFLARIVAVADAFDAMGSDRPYRRGMGDEKLDSVLRGGAGQQWDAEIIDAFFRARDDIREISRKATDEISTELPVWS